MNEELKQLIGIEKYLQLQKKHPQLEELQYVCVCETCDKIFFDQPLAKVQEMMLSGEWDPFEPQLWYVEAGRHWVPQKHHAIRVYVRAKDGDQTLIKDLSAEWSQSTKAYGYTDLALLNDLNTIEQNLKKKS